MLMQPGTGTCYFVCTHSRGYGNMKDTEFMEFSTIAQARYSYMLVHVHTYSTVITSNNTVTGTVRSMTGLLVWPNLKGMKQVIQKLLSDKKHDFEVFKYSERYPPRSPYSDFQ